jgi:hypothetical protein
MPETLDALRRANPRAEPGLDEAVEAVDRVVRAQLGTSLEALPRGRRSRHGLVRFSVALVACTAVAAVVVSTSTGPSGPPSAAAALSKAATLTAAAADKSGTAAVRLKNGDDLLAGATIRWHGNDLSVSSDPSAQLGEAGSKMLSVGGTYLVIGRLAAEWGWTAFGSPHVIDSGNGTTSAEYLAAVRNNVGGDTLKRITGAMTNPTTRQLADGSTVYSGPVKADEVTVATGPDNNGIETRVLPFGFVAHGGVAEPGSPLETSVTVGADGVIRGLSITWGPWAYTVGYSDLGSTRALDVPKKAKARAPRQG